MSGSGAGGGGGPGGAATAGPCSSIAAAAAAPSASAWQPRRLPVSLIPASSPTSPAPGGNGTAAAARALILASPGDIVSPATPSSASRGAKPCLQSLQWYQALLRVTGPSTVSKVLSR